ncbi:hypothetical protein C8R44DRAFT_732017 [Mycena epipterygia]|nr:hypothetical protein C8R44DRAFT_732017 [Mycena epipterygia]
MNGWIIDLQFDTKSICDTGSFSTAPINYAARLATHRLGCIWGQGTKDMYMPTAGVAAFLQPRTATPSLGRHTQAAHAQPAGKCAGTSARAVCVGRAVLAHARVPPSAHPKTQEQQENRTTPSRRPQTDMAGLKEYLKEQRHSVGSNARRRPSWEVGRCNSVYHWEEKEARRKSKKSKQHSYTMNDAEAPEGWKDIVNVPQVVKEKTQPRARRPVLVVHVCRDREGIWPADPPDPAAKSSKH